MQLTFLGAAGEVTGSCYLVDTGETRFLVDCGMFQGGGDAERKNRSFAFDPRDIAFVLLSHAHVDHSGLIPRLVALGFRGAVYTTRATADLLAVMLPDSAHLQEREAEYAGRRRSGRDRDATPLYTVLQALASLERLHAGEYDEPVRLHPSVRCVFRDAGHILGSAIVFVGFQAEGTLGRRIVDGAETVRFFGEEHPVRAKVYTINGLSAHADQAALLAWLGGCRRPPRATWVVHGEPLAAHALREAIEKRLGWRAAVPSSGQTVALGSGA